MSSAIGEELPKNVGIDSYDILPLLLGTQKSAVRDVSVYKSSFLAIRKGKYKYLDGKGSGGFTKVKVTPDDPPGQLCDLEKDPGETKNVYKQYTELVKELKMLLNKYRKQKEPK